jgi:hypothetical protein
MRLACKHAFILPCVLLGVAACAPLGGRDAPGGLGGRGGDWGGADGGPWQAVRLRPGNGGLSAADQFRIGLQETVQALELNPKQRVLWEAYQDKVGALMNDINKIEPYRPPRQTAAQQIGRKVDLARNRLAALDEVQEAAALLYLSLNEDQRKIADQRLAATLPNLYAGPASDCAGDMPRGGSERGGRGGMGGGMGGGGMGGMRMPGGF